MSVCAVADQRSLEVIEIRQSCKYADDKRWRFVIHNGTVELIERELCRPHARPKPKPPAHVPVEVRTAFLVEIEQEQWEAVISEKPPDEWEVSR